MKDNVLTIFNIVKSLNQNFWNCLNNPFSFGYWKNVKTGEISYSYKFERLTEDVSIVMLEILDEPVRD